MILIIGVGNPLRRDDGVGQAAALELADSLPHADLEVLNVHQLTPELAEPISRARRVIFMDANAETDPGTIRLETIGPADDPGSAFSHHVSPSGLLAAARHLYGSTAEGILLTMGAESFEFGDLFSPAVRQAFAAFVNAAKRVAEG